MATPKKKTTKRKTWRQKLESEHASHGSVVDIPPKMQQRLGAGKMLIPKPLDVDAMMRKTRKGKLVTIGQIRNQLAMDAGVDCTCAITTGIFARIAAEAAEEDRAIGKKRVTPYWRAIKDDGKLNEKFPGGAVAQAGLLSAEGLSIVPGKGKQPPRVEDFEKYLIR